MIFSYSDVLAKDISVGYKINNLLKLYGYYNIPNGFVIYSEKGNYININYKNIISNFNNYSGNFIIRTSSNIEDNFNYSFAGMFNSLKISSLSELKNGIYSIIANTDFSSINLFMEKVGLKSDIKLYFLVQEFIDGDFSGVYFSNYNNSELLEYVKGTNNFLVDGLKNASKVFIFGKKKYTYEGDKFLSHEKILQIVSTFYEIKNIFNFEVDIEWTIKDDKLYILQVRPITTI